MQMAKTFIFTGMEVKSSSDEVMAVTWGCSLGFLPHSQQLQRTGQDPMRVSKAPENGLKLECGPWA